MTEPAIRVTDVGKIFPVPFRRRRIVALQNLSLKIAAGEVYGLLGPNGSGKSTTLKIILGLLQPTHGSVSIFGRDNSAVAVRREIGFLPENAYFHKFLTGTETLRFHARLSGMSGTATKSRITDLLATVGLTRAADARLATYSKGMLQRIGLAQALIHDPKILILDEPTAAVDPAGSRDIQNLIVSLKKRGTTILLSSHLLTQVQEVCDRVGILHRGKLLREGHLQDLLAIENQTEIILENATPDLLAGLERQIASANARVILRRKPQSSLEQLFLKVTETSDE
ncbi:MAG: ABC transporter ATP-binding protein [Verrucomicrobia bacterium]|nr:MAG: ABC transporter ATP-binding protein [Verrucomicrobiota bacterium]